MKLQNLLLTFLLLGTQVSLAEDNKAIHPAPKEPKLISMELLGSFKKGISLPPTLASAAQEQDEKELKNFQKTRTEDDCIRAKSEVYVSLGSFFGAPYGNLSQSEVETLSPFFEQIRNDADYYIQLLKKEYPRQRPFAYIEGLNPCVAKEITGAYPSGHSTLARLYGSILKDIFPNRKAAIDLRAQTIATDRVLSGMHHPTDIRAGRELGDQLYKELKKNSNYQKLFAENLKKISK